MDKIFSVDELAKTGNTTPRAIRLYVDKGLLEPTRVGRTLCFHRDATRHLEDILRAKRLGFSLKEIKNCHKNQNAAPLKQAIKRIQDLKSDAEIEVAALESRLNKIQKRR